MKFAVTFIICLFSTIIYAQYNYYTPAVIFLKTGEVLTGIARLSMSRNSTEHPDEKNTISFQIRIGNKEYLRFVKGKERRSSNFSPKEINKVIFDLQYKEKKKIVKRKATFIPIYKNLDMTKMGFAELVIDGKIKMVKKKISRAGVI